MTSGFDLAGHTQAKSIVGAGINTWCIITHSDSKIFCKSDDSDFISKAPKSTKAIKLKAKVTRVELDFQPLGHVCFISDKNKIGCFGDKKLYTLPEIPKPVAKN